MDGVSTPKSTAILEDGDGKRSRTGIVEAGVLEETFMLEEKVLMLLGPLHSAHQIDRHPSGIGELGMPVRRNECQAWMVQL